MGDIDFSNEGLSERVVSEEPASGVEEAVEESVADTGDEAVVEPEQVDEAPAEGAEEVSDVESAEAEAVEPDAYEVRYQEAQKLIGRQGQELGELRKMVEQMQQQTVEPEPEYEQPVFQGKTPTTPQELILMAGAPEDAGDAFEFAVQYAPEYLPDVIAEVESYDPATAKRMEMAYYTHMMEQQAQQVQQVDPYLQSFAIQQRQQAVVESIAQTIPGFNEMRGSIAQIIEEEPDLMGDGSPQAVERGLRWAARMAQQVSDHAAQQAQSQVQQQSASKRAQAVVESGTPAAAPPVVEHSEADAIRAGIFAQDKVRRELFG